MEADEIELIDPEVMGVKVAGLTVAQIQKIKAFYVNRTGDVDCERIEHFTKGL